MSSIAKRSIVVASLIGAGIYLHFSSVSGVDTRVKSYIVEETSEETIQSQETSNQPQILPKYSELYQVNNDLVGYIYLDDEHEYPIVQRKDDQNFYLYKDFFGDDDKSGTIFLNSKCNLGDKGISLVYGHHMRDGSKFGDISELQPQSRLQLDTIFESHEYEVVGSCICNLDDDFKYYSYTGQQSSYNFEVWKQNISNKCVKGSLDSLTKDDVIVELSTCSYKHKNDRLIVILKEVC